MSRHTVNQIAQRHQVMRMRGFRNETITCRDIGFTYYIMSSDMMPGFPDFTHCILAFERTPGDPYSGGVFGISDAVPEDFRELAMHYEILHHWFYATPKEAAQDEVRMLMASAMSNERQTEYIAWRRDFFGRLAVHGNTHGESDEKCAEYEELETFFFTLSGVT